MKESRKPFNPTPTLCRPNPAAKVRVFDLEGPFGSMMLMIRLTRDRSSDNSDASDSRYQGNCTDCTSHDHDNGL